MNKINWDEPIIYLGYHNKPCDALVLAKNKNGYLVMYERYDGERAATIFKENSPLIRNKKNSKNNGKDVKHYQLRITCSEWDGVIDLRPETQSFILSGGFSEYTSHDVVKILQQVVRDINHA